MFTKWIEVWNRVLNRVREQGGDIQELELEPPASPEELHDKEQELGVRIPASLRELLAEHTRKLYFRWSLPDEAILPEEFKEIFSGELGWSLEELEYWKEDSAEASGCEGLAGMIVFGQAGNGDMLALDMNQEAAGEPPVVYWEHETDEVRLVASSFQEYVQKMTELSCIGSELWQYEAFLGPDGLDTGSEQAQRWKSWFALFQSLRFEEASRTLDSLFTKVSRGSESPGNGGSSQVSGRRCFSAGPAAAAGEYTRREDRAQPDCRGRAGKPCSSMGARALGGVGAASDSRDTLILDGPLFALGGGLPPGDDIFGAGNGRQNERV